jgi:hypothetical protein
MPGSHNSRYRPTDLTCEERLPYLDIPPCLSSDSDGIKKENYFIKEKRDSLYKTLRQFLSKQVYSSWQDRIILN